MKLFRGSFGILDDTGYGRGYECRKGQRIYQ